MKSGDYIQYTFPPELSIPSPLACGPVLQLSAVTCTKIGTNQMKVVFTFPNSDVLVQKTSFSFEIANVKNPPSTKPTQSFTNIKGYDSSNNLIQQYSGSAIITNTQPSEVSFKNLIQTNKNISETSQYTINYTNVNTMSSGSAFTITLPSSVQNPTTLDTCSVLYKGTTYPMVCQITSDRNIKISGGLTTAIPANSVIAVNFGPIRNPDDQNNILSLSMKSFTDDTLQYQIDQISNGLIPSFACKLPCKTCPATKGQEGFCLSCFSTAAEKFFYNNNCQSTCPSGTYADTVNNVCAACNPACATCTDGNTCSTCVKGGATPYLYNNLCVKTCPDGQYADANNVCQPCSTNCKTCNIKATNCTSCQPPPANLSFWQEYNCLSGCDKGYYSNNYNCTKCTAPCATCLLSSNNCQSCLTGFIYGTQCITTCPNGTVPQINGTSAKCLGCDPKCLNCSTNKTGSCLVCQKGYFLFEDICITGCPDGYYADPTKTFCLKNQTKPIITYNITTTGNGTGSVSVSYVEDPKKRIYLYFPVLITQSTLGALTVGSFLKNKASIIPSNAVALWAPLEFIAYGAQVVLSYYWVTDQQVKNYNYATTASANVNVNGTNGNVNVTNSSSINTGRMLAVENLINFDMPVQPFVFYGTAFAFVMLLILNLVYFIIYMVLIRKDMGYIEHRSRNKHLPRVINLVSFILNFKFSNFYYSRFFGSSKFYVRFDNADKFHRILNILSITNIIVTLLPIIAFDIYGLIKYQWGSQLFIMLIETLVLSTFVLAATIWDFEAQKVALKPQYEQMVYAQVADQSSIEDQVMKRMDEEMRKRFGGQTLDEYLEYLKNQRAIEAAAYNTNRPLKKANSMIDLGDRTKEQDDRRVNTDPLDDKQKKKYDKWVNPFEIDKYPDNCYFEPGNGEKKQLDPSQIATKVIQYGDPAINGEDYDKHYDQMLRELFHGRNPADERGESRYLSNKLGRDGSLEDDLQLVMQQNQQRKKNRLRGRKGKYYEQVDDEDQTFLNDQERFNEDDEDDEDRLDMIEEEESHHSHEDLEKQILEDNKDKIDQEQQQLQQQQDELDQQKLLKEQANEQKLIDKSILEEEENKILTEDNQMFDVVDAVGEGDYMPQDLNKTENDLDETAQQLLQKDDNIDIEANNLQLDQSLNEQDLINPSQHLDVLAMGAPPSAGNIHEEEEQIIKEHQNDKDNDKTGNGDDSEMGEPDSDDDDEQRIKNMRDPEKKRFNINDILGDFDRDDKGNIVILQENRTGNLIDKEGNRVNEKGYLIDEKTGDVVEKEKRLKIFDSKELDERGELPPPFNLERFNFNIHDVRGYFDRDANGNEIIWNRKDGDGNPIDKLGRRINEHGYLVDAQGNLVDKRGRIKLHRQIMEQNGGEIPLLFNYKGKKFDIIEVTGELDKDRNGNMIIRRDKDNQMVDKKGRRVNNKGYLIDKDGNVINRDGKIMFEVFSLSKDNEIPKLFPFLKFNIDDIKGDYEMDPLGNPMLQKTRDGELVDQKGRRVNEKGYLLDDQGHIRNKRGFRVFSKLLLEDDGDIPKIFRTGLLRKDTYDSFSQLMSEIEDLERMQEMDENDPRRIAMKNKMAKENERLQKRIDKIVEEDNDDDDMLMKELEDLANGQGLSDIDGGNTSVESMMEDTPSNYNTANQRFNEIEDIKNQARLNMRNQKQVFEDDEYESEYSYLPGKKMKKKKKKKKKKKRDTGDIDVRELMMAKAYGGLSQAQIDKLIAMKRMKDAQSSITVNNYNNTGLGNIGPGGQSSSMMLGMGGGIPPSTAIGNFGGGVQSQLGQTAMSSMMATGAIGINKPPIQRMASNNRMATVHNSRRHLGQNKLTTVQQDDLKSEFGVESMKDNNASMLVQPMGKLQAQTQMRHGTSTQRAHNMNKTTSRMNNNLDTQSSKMKPQIRTNNLMSDKDQQSEISDKQGYQNNSNNLQEGRDRRLSQIANSVSGFYKDRDGGASEKSLMRSTHESNFAQNLGKMRGQKGQFDEEFKKMPTQKRILDTAGPSGSQGLNDPELDRIYGTARNGINGINGLSALNNGITGNNGNGGFGDMGRGGLADITMLSDWEKESQRSGRSARSQFGGIVNTLKVRGLENIYLQRLEPATKGRKTQLKKGGGENSNKAKFRVMHHKFHDEPEWHVDEPRDELDSVISDNYKQMEKRFVQEFQGTSSGGKKKGKDDKISGKKANIFNGNFKNYKPPKGGNNIGGGVRSGSQARIDLIK